MPVSIKTYSSLFQSRRAYSPMVFELATQTNADSSRDEGSRRKTFMTTPMVLNVASSEKTGSPSSGNSSFISTNSITRSSNLLLNVRCQSECTTCHRKSLTTAAGPSPS